MKFRLAWVLVSGIALGGFVRAEDAKPVEAPKVEVKSGDQTRSGKLMAKAATAPEGVVAALRIGDLDIHLAASGELAAKLTELLKKNAEVQVSGPLSAGVMTVAQVIEIEKPAAPPADNGKGKNKKRRKGSPA